MENKSLRNAHLDGNPFFWEAGPTGLLLLHGFTATTVEMRLLAHRLYHRGYTVSAPLLPGHGTTPEDLNRTRWQDWVRTAEQSYQQLRDYCQNVFIAGESMGGVLSLYLTSQHPEVRGVITYAPAIKLALDALSVLKLYLGAPFTTSVSKGVIDDAGGWQGYYVNPLRGVIQLRRLQREVRYRLSQIHQPLMVIQGRLDQTIHPTSGEIILNGVSSAEKERHWLENSAHVVVLDREVDELTELTLRFLERVLGSKTEA